MKIRFRDDPIERALDLRGKLGPEPDALPLIHQLAGAGYRLYATEGTSRTIAALGLSVTPVTKVLTGDHPNVVDVIQDGTVQCVMAKSDVGEELFGRGGHERDCKEQPAICVRAAQWVP